MKITITNTYIKLGRTKYYGTTKLIDKIMKAIEEQEKIEEIAIETDIKKGKKELPPKK